MNRTLLTLAMASLLATGCAGVNLAPTAATPAVARTEKAPSAAAADTAAEADPVADATPIEAETTGARRAGDFIVRRFTGSFRKTPITLTERVLARRGPLLTVEITAEAGATKRRLHVTINEASAVKNDIVAVRVIEGDTETPAGIDAYEALLAETSLTADENEAMLGSEEAMLDIGGAPLPVRKTSYRVRVGKASATMRTVECDGFAWGDLGGDITAKNGKVLYHAEVVELGHADQTGVATARAEAP